MKKKFETFLEKRGLRKSFLKYCNKESYLNILLLKDMPEGEDLWFNTNRFWNETLEDMETCRRVVVLNVYGDYICLGYELFGCTDKKVIMIRK